MRTATSIALFFALTFSFPVHADTPPPASVNSAPADSRPQSIWQTDSDGTARHLQSGLVCPVIAGAFHIDKVMAFDPFGLDVGCNYHGPTGDAVTVYITKRGAQDLQAAFAQANVELTTAHIDASPLVADDKPNLPSDTPWLSSLYLEKTLNLHSGLWVADYSGWTFEFRATYPAERAQQAFDAMAALTETAMDARSHLDACAKQPVPQRTGMAIEEKDKLLQLSLVAGLTLRAADKAVASQNLAPPVWCAEQSLLVEQVPMLLWRDISGGDHPSDRVSLMTLGPSPSLDIRAEPLANFALAAGQGGTVYEASLAEGDVIYMFAFFGDRPDTKLLAPLAKRIFTGQVQPLSNFNKKSNTVGISPQK